MENNNKFKNNLETLFGSLDDFISTKTVVGEPIHIGDVIMLPLIDVFFGLGAGGTESREKGAGHKAAVGAKITPSAVIVIKDGTVQLVNVKNQDALSKLIDMAPGVLAKFNLSGTDSKKEASNTASKETIKTETVTETIVALSDTE